MPKCKTDKKYILEIWTVTKNLKIVIAHTRAIFIEPSVYRMSFYIFLVLFKHKQNMHMDFLFIFFPA